MQMSSKILLIFSYLFSSNDSIQHQLHSRCGPAPRIVFIHFTIIWTRSHRLQNWSLILQSVYNQPTSPPLSNLSGILWLCLFKLSQFLISSCENENKTRITTCLQSVWEKYFYKELSLAFKAKCVYCWQRRVNVFVLSSCLVDQDCYAKRLYCLGLNTDDWVVHYQFHSLGSTDPQLTILSQILC